MEKLIKILLIEDSSDDAFLVTRELKKTYNNLIINRVDNKNDFIQQINESNDYNLIITDYNLPTFSALNVLKILKEMYMDIPCIVISGIMGEDTAIETMKAGAVDYILKDNIKRLIPAIEREITEYEFRKTHNETKLRLTKSQESYRNIFSKNEVIMFLVNKETGNIIEANPAACAFYQYSENEFNKLNFRELEISIQNHESKTDLLIKGDISHCLITHKNKKGTPQILEIYTSHIPYTNSEGNALHCILFDVTEKIRIENERNRLFDLSVDLLIIYGYDGFFKQCNPACTRILGWLHSELVSRQWIDFVHPDDKTRVLEAHKAIDKNKPIMWLECRFLCKNGEYKWLSWNSFSFKEENMIYAVVRDVTNRKQYETALSQSEERFSKAFSASPHAMMIIRYDNILVLEMNEMWEKLFGYTRDELIGKPLPWHDIFLNPNLFSESIKVLEKKNALRDYTMEIFHKNGDVKIISITAEVTEIAGIKCILSVVRDITEELRVQSALIESEEKFRKLSENTSAAIMIYQNNKFVFSNPAGELITGYSRNELYHMDFWDVVHPDFKIITQEKGTARLLDKALPQHYELKIITKKGVEKWIDLTSEVIEFKGVTSGLVIAMDVTSRKNAEEARKHTQKLYETIADNMPNSIVSVVDKNFILRLNYGKDLKKIGLSSKFLENKKIDDIFPQADAEYLKEKCKKVFKGEMLSFELRFAGYYYFVNAVPMPSQKNEPENILLLYQNIHHLKQTENMLLESRELYKVYIESTNDYSFLKDNNLRYTIVNKILAAFLGRDANTIIGRTDNDIFDNELAEKLKKEDLEVIKGDKLIISEQIINNRICEVRKFPVSLMNGEKGVGGMIRDITNLKKAQEEERKIAHEIETLSAIAMDFIRFPLGKNIFRYIGEQLQSVLGDEKVIIVNSYSKKTNILSPEYFSTFKTKESENIFHLIKTDIKPYVVKTISPVYKILLKGRLLNLGNNYKEVFYNKISNSIVKNFEKVYSPENYYTIGLVSENELLGSINIITSKNHSNINEYFIAAFAYQASIIIRKHMAEDALAVSERRFRTLFEKNNDIIFTMNMDGEITSVNPIGEKLITGKFRRGLKIHSFVTGESFEKLRTQIKRNIHGGIIHSFNEVEVIARNGQILSFEVSYLIQVKNNNPYEIFGVARNQTRNKMMQNQILIKIIETEEREKKLLSEELHDGLGSLLSTINIFVNLLQKKNKSEEDREIYLDNLKKLVNDAVQNIRHYSNSLAPNVLNDFGLTHAVKLYTEKINLTYPGLIEYQNQEFKPRLDRIIEVNLYRIILELINNSLKYAEPTKIHISITLLKDIVTLNYSDNGKGFNVKRVINSRTSGMGVKNIHTRVNSLNGKCNFSSSSDIGTNVKIEISKKYKQMFHQAEQQTQIQFFEDDSEFK